MATRREKKRHKKVRERKQQDVKKKRTLRRTAPPRALNWLKQAYGRPFLAGFGPLLSATWEQPSALQAGIRASGQIPASPYGGVLLLDTGATRTSISLAAANALGLKPTRMVDGYGSGGSTRNPVFFVKLQIGMTDGERTTVMTWEIEAQGIPDLDKPARAAAITQNGVPVELVGLLGRDILANTRFEYDGLAGEIKIRFNLDAMNPAAPTKASGFPLVSP